ncbi:MAG: hypothetical protein R3343_12110 [Nitriliruptorales bacterium]|nr:hypothetical protein [Nitriliruptorales bacterium]
MRGSLDRFEGCIAGARFRSGDQVVVGLWRRSPLGGFADVMWLTPGGERVLLAPGGDIADYVSDLYSFDDVRVAEVRSAWDGTMLEVRADPLGLQLEIGEPSWRSRVFELRPRWLRRQRWWIELENRLVGPLGELLLEGADGVRLAGTTRSGRREWYSVDGHRPVVAGKLSVHGRDAGALEAMQPGLGVGISDFPTEPAVVEVVTFIEPGQRPVSRAAAGPGT